MSRRAQENLVAGLLALLFIATIAMSLQYGPRARMVPIPIASIGLILIVIQIIWQNTRSADELQIDMFDLLTRGRVERAEPAAEMAESALEPPTTTAEAPVFARELKGIAVVLVLMAMFVSLTPLPAVFLFTAGYFIATRHYPVVRAVTYSAALTVAIYLVFSVALNIRLDLSIFGRGMLGFITL